MVISLVQGPQSNSQNAGNPIKNTQYNIKHAGSQGYENTRMQNEKTEDTRIQDRGDASQPGGPSTEGPADYLINNQLTNYIINIMLLGRLRRF